MLIKKGICLLFLCYTTKLATENIQMGTTIVRMCYNNSQNVLQLLFLGIIHQRGTSNLKDIQNSS